MGVPQQFLKQFFKKAIFEKHSLLGMHKRYFGNRNKSAILPPGFLFFSLTVPVTTVHHEMISVTCFQMHSKTQQQFWRRQMSLRKNSKWFTYILIKGMMHNSLCMYGLLTDWLLSLQTREEGVSLWWKTLAGSQSQHQHRTYWQHIFNMTHDNGTSVICLQTQKV